MYETGLFIFHRDFRIQDNTGLNVALSECNNVYCCFVFTPEQVGPSNEYKSNNSVQFMIESLDDLRREIESQGGKFIICYGQHIRVIDTIIHALNIQSVYCNHDYTPYALQRENSVKEMCERNRVRFNAISGDYYLYEPGTVLTGQRSGFKKYTPFYNTVIHSNVRAPSYKRKFRFGNTNHIFDYSIALDDAMTRFVKRPNPDILVEGGRTRGINQLKKAIKTQTDYEKSRDTLTYNTTFLSAYIKFGCVSIREVYHTFSKEFGRNSGIIRELVWREFFAHVLYNYPEVVGQSYQSRYRGIRWRHSDADFNAWKTGNTGFPVVDAGMRQMNKTGYMHNRVRMIVASFLIKVLLIDWRKGEQYFAQKLTDYDIASNNGNWQGISGTGVDMKPYFRDMNPWIQSAKFDKDAEYIKTWIPELKDVDARDIHTWHEKYREYEGRCSYNRPMVDYYEQKKKMLEMYSRV